SQPAATRNRGERIDKLMALISLSFKKIYKPTNNNLRISSNTSRAHHDNTPRINKGTGYNNHRVVNVARARENVVDWRDDTDDEPEDQELEAHYLYMAKIQEVTPNAADNSGPIFDSELLQKVQNDNDNYNVFANDGEHLEQLESVDDTYLEEQGDTNITIDSLDMSTNGEMVDQDDDDLAKERDLLASLIEKLKCEIDDNKNRNKFLESSNKTLIDKLKGEIEDFKTKNKSLESSNNHFKEANNELSQTNQLMFKDLKKFQVELDSFVKPEYLKKAQRANPRLYDIGCYNDNLALMLAPESDEMIHLAKESRSKLRVIPTTSVSRPQLKSNQLEDRVMHNNSEGKKQQVEDHRRNFKFSNNKTSITACNDSLNAKTSNVNFICVTCGKCVLKDNHDMCVLYYINGVNTRTKQPIAVPISTIEPKRTVNQSAATPLKRILMEIILFFIDSRCSKHMMGNLKLLSNFMEQFLGTVKFRNDQMASILGYGDLVQGNVTIKRVYYVEGLNHNLFFVGQLCDADLEVAFRKSTCYIRDLKGNDLLTGSCGTDLCGTDLYFITLQVTSTPNPIFLMAKASSGLHAQVRTVRTDKGTKFLNKTLHVYFAQEAIKHQTSTARTPKQNSVVERWNGTLVEAARTMLSAAKVALFFWTEAIATTCFTQNRSLVITLHEKTHYHIINGQKSSVKFFYIFGSLCYIIGDGENLDKMKEKSDACIFVGYSTQSRAYRVYNKRIRVIVETVHVNVDGLLHMASDHVTETITTSNEMEFLFSPIFDELLNGTTQVVSKPSAVNTADAPDKRQQQNITQSTTTTIVADTPPLKIQTTPETTSQAPTQTPTVI
ncbi:retrotransposon protein, putative, ty1-copia subclass, partial [Tanacetum coccineum]